MLEKVRSEYWNKGVEVVAINILPQFALPLWEEYGRKLGLKNAIYAQDTNGEAIRAFQVNTPGTTIVINKKGVGVYRDNSATSYEQLKLAVAMGL